MLRFVSSHMMYIQIDDTHIDRTKYYFRVIYYHRPRKIIVINRVSLLV